MSLPSSAWISAAGRSQQQRIQSEFTASSSLDTAAWFQIGLVKCARNMTYGIPLHITRLCVIERMPGISKWLKAHAHRNSFANTLGGLDRPLPGKDFPSSNGA